MNNDKAVSLMPVICLDSGKFPNQGKKGEKYFIDRMSIYMDYDGDAYGFLYEDNKAENPMANVSLHRFMSI